ncbi:MAG: uroporphyrinogen-III synthase [Bradymonadaceae bacterium]|nr:uroporphyrinogen-III synthase [Lujinxingiaceae bacterium]
MSRPRQISIVYTGIRAPDTCSPEVALTHVALLDAQPIAFDRARIAELLTGPAAVVFYSQNAARFVIESGVLDGLELGDKRFWAVGQQTASLLAGKLGVDVCVPDKQTFEGLKEAFELAALPPNIVAFSLRGSWRDLSALCQRRAIALTDIPVYETSASGSNDLLTILEQASPEWIVFTSPRGVQSFAERVEHIAATWRFAAIGPSTARALAEVGILADHIMDVPNRNRIIDEIVALEQKRTP